MKKRGPGRPSLGHDARSVVVSVRITRAKAKALARYVEKENAEVNASPTAEDRKPATVSSWMQDMIDDALHSIGISDE